jgi:hypothetical protein
MDPPPPNPRAVVEFLRREAPFEFERLRSISQLVSSWSEADSARPGSRNSPYAAWLRETFGLFDSASGSGASAA